MKGKARCYTNHSIRRHDAGPCSALLAEPMSIEWILCYLRRLFPPVRSVQPLDLCVRSFFVPELVNSSICLFPGTQGPLELLAESSLVSASGGLIPMPTRSILSGLIGSCASPLLPGNSLISSLSYELRFYLRGGESNLV